MNQMIGKFGIQDAPRTPEDGRQSETALRVARGARRLLRAHGLASVTEMPLPSGRRADIVALAADGQIVIVEVKSSMADFRADLKWPDYRMHCDRLYFAIPTELPESALPEDAGLIVADAYGAEFVRMAPEHRLAGATRRSMLLRFGHFAADRLHRLWDADLLD
ncbi:MAG: uncharacterized protein JWN07_1156 [Hyphomicrobiales bacterium]|nr:uncharacterized protein [Hyphomicrobiales bacterium]